MKIKKFFLIILLISNSFIFAKDIKLKDVRLEIINNTPDNLFIYTQFTRWTILSGILENAGIAILDIINSSAPAAYIPFVKLDDGILFYLKSGEIYKSASTKDIHKLYIKNATGIQNTKKKIKKKDFYIKIENFKIEGENTLQNKIDVKRKKITKVYIESGENGYKVWATKPVR